MIGPLKIFRVGTWGTMGFMLVNQKKKSVVYRKKSRVDFKCSAPNEQKEAYEKLDIRVQIDRVSV
jgi:hypothetical protein